MKDFRQLESWKRAHKVTLAIYAITKGSPIDERFGLTSQLRRAAVSISSNIAEGCGRSGDPELGRFCQNAMASAREVDYQLELSKDLGYSETTEYDSFSQELIALKRLLNAFVQKLTANR